MRRVRWFDRRIALSVGVPFVVAGWLVAVGSAPACGCGVMVRVGALADRVLVSDHAGTETIVTQLSVAGSDRAVLFAVPGSARVRIVRGVDNMFDELDAATA